MQVLALNAAEPALSQSDNCAVRQLCSVFSEMTSKRTVSMQSECVPSEGKYISKRSADVHELASLDESEGQGLLLLSSCLHFSHLLTSCGCHTAL